MHDAPGQTEQQAAWREAVMAHAPSARAIVARHLGEAALVDDVLHEVLLQAMDRPSNGEPVRDAGAWLRGVAIRQVRMHRRARLRRRCRESAAAHAPDAADAWTPLELILRAEQRGLLADALDDLDEQTAQLLRLKYAEQWSYQRIADRFGWTWNTVAHRLREARARLRERLGPLFDDDAPENPQ